MEIFKGLISGFKEILYDVFGYLLPGYLVLSILYVPFAINECVSPMYSLLEIFLKANIALDLSTLFQELSFLKILIMSFIAYLLGHIPIFLSSLLVDNVKSFLEKYTTKKSKYFVKSEIIYNNVFSILERRPSFRKDLFYSQNDNSEMIRNKDVIGTFASTYSRFTTHNDLIQKYTYKISFYKSLSCIFFIALADSFLSSFIWVSINSSMYSPTILTQLFLFNLFLLLGFLTFFSQYDKHNNLKNKECYLFLYKYFY